MQLNLVRPDFPRVSDGATGGTPGFLNVPRVNCMGPFGNLRGWLAAKRLQHIAMGVSPWSREIISASREAAEAARIIHDAHFRKVPMCCRRFAA